MSGRCPYCGHSLRGLPGFGRCPECGQGYTPELAAKLQPWPSALAVCLRLGWPLLVLLGSGLLSAMNAQEWMQLVPVWATLVLLAINSWAQVRSMLKRSMPDRERTGGIVVVARALGTLLCFSVLMVLLAVPLLVGACLVMLSAAH